jgi:nitroimidazol reductase NimA-like FMN-containing flavoprotein (pyridoxamine 5'-phosphate oxidase superfamily)
MRETPQDIAELQALLDRSYESAGSHLLSIHTPDWRVEADRLVELLQGMVVLNLATVNSRGEPIQGPVDGQFYRGRFYCGSSRDSIRARHIKANPNVSVAHVRGEELAVVVHGLARAVDTASERAHGYRELVAEIYGAEMTDANWGSEGVVYWEIEPRKMFALAPVIAESA